jgi:hypothetical protein
MGLLIIGLVLMFVGLAFAVAMTALLPVVLFVLIVGGGGAVLAFWIWMLVEAIQNRGLGQGGKVAWVLAIVFLHLLGAILYFFLGRPKRKFPLPAPVPGF